MSKAHATVDLRVHTQSRSPFLDRRVKRTTLTRMATSMSNSRYTMRAPICSRRLRQSKREYETPLRGAIDEGAHAVPRTPGRSRLAQTSLRPRFGLRVKM